MSLTPTSLSELSTIIDLLISEVSIYFNIHDDSYYLKPSLPKPYYHIHFNMDPWVENSKGEILKVQERRFVKLVNNNYQIVTIEEINKFDIESVKKDRNNYINLVDIKDSILNDKLKLLIKYSKYFNSNTLYNIESRSSKDYTLLNNSLFNIPTSIHLISWTKIQFQSNDDWFTSNRELYHVIDMTGGISGLSEAIIYRKYGKNVKFHAWDLKSLNSNWIQPKLKYNINANIFEGSLLNYPFLLSFLSKTPPCCFYVADDIFYCQVESKVDGPLLSEEYMNYINHCDRLKEIVYDYLLLAHVTIMMTKLEENKSGFIYFHKFTPFSLSILTLLNDWFTKINLVKTVTNLQPSFYVSCLMLREASKPVIIDFLKSICARVLNSDTDWSEAFTIASKIRSFKEDSEVPNFDILNFVENLSPLPSIVPLYKIEQLSDGEFLKKCNYWNQMYNYFSKYSFKIRMQFNYANEMINRLACLRKPEKSLQDPTRLKRYFDTWKLRPIAGAPETTNNIKSIAFQPVPEPAKVEPVKVAPIIFQPLYKELPKNNDDDDYYAPSTP